MAPEHEVAGRRSRDSPGPDNARRDDGLDPRWSPSYQNIASHPDLKEDLWDVCSQVWDMGARQHPAGQGNPWWRDNPDVAGHPAVPPPQLSRRRMTTLAADAGNRALRTFLVGLSIDVLVAVTLVLFTVFRDADSWDDIKWGIVGFSLLKTLVATAGSYILRRFLDPSKFPTPLPPAPVPAPADPPPHT